MKPLQPELEQAVQALNTALKQASPLQAYNDTLSKMEDDASATQLLDELQRVQSDLRRRQSDGGISEADTARLHQLQADVQAHPTIAAFLAADQAAKVYLVQLNQFISDLLGIDFAALGRPKSGCC